jgi:hypothetical protein
MDMDERRVLFLGSSLDRNAIDEYFCDGRPWDFDGNHTDFPVQTVWCYNQELNARVGYIFHPGVGENGDLHQPIAQPRGLSTNAILTKYANETSLFMLKGTPHLVVVDSSLWDLLVWRLGALGSSVPGQAYKFPTPKPVTEARVRQWCTQDLRNLLEKVSEVFPTSRIAFRTAPTIDHTPKYEKFEKHDIEMLYQCISSSTTNGILFGKYELIDYHAMMENLIDHNIPNLFKTDGYHPTWYPSALYINEVLRRVGLHPQDPPLEETRHHVPEAAAATPEAAAAAPLEAAAAPPEAAAAPPEAAAALPEAPTTIPQAAAPPESPISISTSTSSTTSSSTTHSVEPETDTEHTPVSPTKTAEVQPEKSFSVRMGARGRGLLFAVAFGASQL